MVKSLTLLMFKKIDDFKNSFNIESHPFQNNEKSKEMDIIYKVGLKNYFNVQYSVEIEIGD
jgi:hypothetical protein